MAISRAIVYVVDGQSYLQEAIKSIDSVDAQYPCVVCRTAGWQLTKAEVFDLPPRQSEHWFLDRVRYFNLILDHLDYDQILFLDSDTYICGDLSGFFDILDRFDIAGTQAISRQTLQRDDIPISFPELHCGAMSVNVNRRIKDLFELWFQIYQERPFYWGNDQPPLRQALWEKQPPYFHVRLAILPVEFCFRYRWGGLLSRKVVLLHGKEHNTPYEQVAEEVNRDTGIRIYHRRELA